MLRSIARSILVTGIFAAVSLPALARYPEPGMLTPGTTAPTFTADSYGGGMIQLGDLKGKVVVVDFWATWCGPCNILMPHLQEIQSKYAGKNVYVMALCVWDTPDNANAWIPNHPQYTFHFAYDASGGGRSNKGISEAYVVHAIPSTYIIDADGVIVDGGCELDESEIATAVDTGLNRLKSEARADMSADAPAVRAGEILLAGTISTAYDAQKGSFDLAVSAVEPAGGKLTKLTAARTKTVVVTGSTTITAQGMTPHSNDLSAGTEVYVVGRDTGAGKGLDARAVQLAQ